MVMIFAALGAPVVFFALSVAAPPSVPEPHSKPAITQSSLAAVLATIHVSNFAPFTLGVSSVLKNMLPSMSMPFRLLSVISCAVRYQGKSSSPVIPS